MEDILDFEELPTNLQDQYSKRIRKIKRLNRFIYVGILFYPVLMRIPVYLLSTINLNFRIGFIATGKMIQYCLLLWIGSMILGAIIALFPFGNFIYSQRFALSALYTALVTGIFTLAALFFGSIALYFKF